MDANVIIDALGQGQVSSAVANLLKLCGYTKPLKPKRGETSVDLELFGLGLALSFEEVDAGDSATQHLPEGSQALVAAFLYGPDHPEYKAFAGALPFGLTFADSRMVANKKLGVSEHWSNDFQSSTWERDGLTVIASYADGGTRIEQIQLSK